MTAMSYPSEEVWDRIYRNSMSYQIAQQAEVRRHGRYAGLEDCIPEIDDVVPASDGSFKEYIKRLDAATALERLTIKRPIPTRLRNGDGNKFRCPWPEHRDETPSAWINTANNTWCCAPCGNAGGDWIELAAAARGYTTRGGKLRDTGRFGELMRELEIEFGWHKTTLVCVEGDEPSEPPAVTKSRWDLDA